MSNANICGRFRCSKKVEKSWLKQINQDGRSTVCEVAYSYTVHFNSCSLLEAKNATLPSNRVVSLKGHTGVIWCPGHEKNLASPCSNLRSCRHTVLKKVLAILLGLFCAPQWFRLRGIIPALASLDTPLYVKNTFRILVKNTFRILETRFGVNDVLVLLFNNRIIKTWKFVSALESIWYKIWFILTAVNNEASAEILKTRVNRMHHQESTAINLLFTQHCRSLFHSIEPCHHRCSPVLVNRVYCTPQGVPEFSKGVPPRWGVQGCTSWMLFRNNHIVSPIMFLTPSSVC